MKAIAGYPDLSALTSLLTGPLANSSYGFLSMLNSTSNSSSVTLFAPINSAFARFEADAAVSSLVFASYNAPAYGDITLLETALANHILPNYANSTILAQVLAAANSSRSLIFDLSYGKTELLTLAGLNVTLRGIVQQKGTELPVALLSFVQNAFVLQANAIVAANGVVHLISNIIDPFIGATGGFFGPTKEVIEGVESAFAPIVQFAVNAFNL
jgi:uncharacterized surface protein with fasciclin (FAS1) repeats